VQVSRTFILLFVVFALAGCNRDNPNQSASPADKVPPARQTIDLEPFKSLARGASCADKSNRLFLIDDRLVFWDRDSRCADAAYARVLYAGRVDHVVCDLHDSIAGPQRSCEASGDDAALFDIMVEHLDASDLGLGSGHTVRAIEF
jgi:hypothetical protein